jgi:hypothetical protein
MGSQSWYSTPPTRSPPASVVSIPSRGWASPTVSVRSEPLLPQRGIQSRPGVRRPPLCYVCYQFGHWLTDCPSIPVEVRLIAHQNRDAHLRANQKLPRGPPAHSQYGHASRNAAAMCTMDCSAPDEGIGDIPGILMDGRSAWPPVEVETPRGALALKAQSPDLGMTPEGVENDEGGN